jgi:hypothetical protein
MGMSVTHLVASASERVVHQGFNQKRSSNRSSRRMFESPVITLNFIVDRLLQGKEENFQGQTDCPRPKGKIKLQVTVCSKKKKKTGDGLDTDTVHEIQLFTAPL